MDFRLSGYKGLKRHIAEWVELYEEKGFAS
jgi:hypothetical protein